MKNIISVGSRVETLAGYEVATGYNGSIVYTDSYEVDADGSATKVNNRMLTLAEIGHLMREVDGKLHEVRFEEGRKIR